MKRLLLYLCLCCLTLRAQPRTEFVVFTEPAGASVYDSYQNFLGKAGQPLELDLSGQGTHLQLVLKMEGYHSKSEEVPTRTLKEQGRWPLEGSVVLSPSSPWTKVRRDAGPFLALMVPFVLLFGFVMLRRHRDLRSTAERVRTLEDLKTRAGNDSLALAQMGRYRLVEKLGAGGMATVYRALPDDSLAESRAVAIKVLAPEVLESGNFQQRFRREVQACVKLEHPRLVSLLDWGQEHDFTYLVFELLEGETLRRRMRKPFSREQALEWLEQIAEGLEFAHARGVVHRDLKPENVMLTARGIKIMDFGLAIAEDSARVTRTGEALGTPAYMAPEQILGQELDPRTDQYAFGCLAYELLAGRPPFPEREALALIHCHLNATPENPHALDPEFPKTAGEVLLAMLAKDLEHRYPTIAEAFAALRDHCEPSR